MRLKRWKKGRLEEKRYYKDDLVVINVNKGEKWSEQREKGKESIKLIWGDTKKRVNWFDLSLLFERDAS